MKPPMIRLHEYYMHPATAVYKLHHNESAETPVVSRESFHSYQFMWILGRGLHHCPVSLCHSAFEPVPAEIPNSYYRWCLQAVSVIHYGAQPCRDMAWPLPAWKTLLGGWKIG